jgi:hypothetical protein
MQINFGQIYATPGVTFPWTIYFQKRLGEKVTALVSPGSKFITRYGEHWSLVIRISAKRGIASSEILGPSVFRQDCSVEYSIFLPYDHIPKGSDFAEPALHSLLAGVREVLTKAGIEHNDLDAAEHRLVVEFSKDPRTIETKEFAQQAVPSDGHKPSSHASSTDPTAPADAH